MSAVETYPAFQKIPRLHKPVTITEKIDGTNALISIREASFDDTQLGDPFHSDGEVWVWREDRTNGALIVRAGSRNRWLTTSDDNYGFARWVSDHSSELVKLGVGHHYGEWWGSGIQRGYGRVRGEKTFSLFNVAKWDDPERRPDCCDVVPVMAMGNGSELNSLVTDSLLDLMAYGSQASQGYMNPEGIVVYHEASRALYKVTLSGDRKSVVPLVRPPKAIEPANMLRPPGFVALALAPAAA